MKEIYVLENCLLLWYFEIYVLDLLIKFNLVKKT